MSEPNLTFTGTTAVTYTFTTHVATGDELRAINQEREMRRAEQEMLDIIDGKVPTLPMWTLFYLPSWLVDFLFWFKKKFNLR